MEVRFTEGRDALEGRGGAGGTGVDTMALYLSVPARQMSSNLVRVCTPCTPIHPLQTQSIIDKPKFNDFVDHTTKELIVTKDSNT